MISGLTACSKRMVVFVCFVMRPIRANMRNKIFIINDKYVLIRRMIVNFNFRSVV